MELKEGMYVRTDREIFKFLKVDEKGIYRRTLSSDNESVTTGFEIKNVKKASHNIIDLIEEHDILLLFDKEYGENYKAEVVLDGNNFKVVVNYEQGNLLNLEYELIAEEHIKLLQILTHEQFEENAYEVN